MILASFFVVGITILFPSLVLITYVLAVVAGHVTPILPFISYTGNKPVESCIFSFAFNITSALYLFIVCLRYSQLLDFISKEEMAERRSKIMKNRNLWSAAIGMLSAGGLSLTGSFQQTSFYVLHVVGVVLCTICTEIYLIFQTYFSYTLLRNVVRPFVKKFRLAVLALATCIHLSSPVFLFFMEPHVPDFRTNGPPPASENIIYASAAALEWVLFTLNIMYVASLYYDFKKILLKKDEIVFAPL